MKITQKFLSLPPYISTSWKNIDTLSVKSPEKDPILLISLHNGTVIEVPGLKSSFIGQIFSAYEAYAEQEEETSSNKDLSKTFQSQGEGRESLSFSFGMPTFSIGEVNSSADFGSFMQHNPEHGNAPKIPEEVLKKMCAIAKAFGMDIDQIDIPKAEPHCNCSYCQLARVLHQEEKSPVENEEEEELVNEEDLRFSEWMIEKEGEKLYTLTRADNPNESYQVYLGNPVGCTCGQADCEHIKTILRS